MSTFYRIVKSNPPTVNDFLSKAALGQRPRFPGLRAARLWDGVSVQTTLEGALELAERFPSLGRFVARINFDAIPDARVEQTGSTGHATIWGEPRAMLEAVESVTPLESQEDRPK